MAELEFDFSARFEQAEKFYRTWVGDLTEEPDAVLMAAKTRYADMGPTLAYIDEPDHPMAFSLFTCAALLCLYLELEARGVDVHGFGTRMLLALSEATQAAKTARGTSGKVDLAGLRDRIGQLENAGARSQQDGQPGQFVFDVDWQDDETGRWTMEVSRCGICHLFGQHDAMALVPYMCATDDVMSDMNDEGLSRTGTIALGRTACDFHYRPGQPTEPLASNYPDRIRIV